MPLEETLRHRYFIKAAGDLHPGYVTLLRYEPHFDPVVDGEQTALQSTASWNPMAYV
ncbi:hypothetical protein SCLCIDRAFT_20733 [Scleroderma citrinum Foug A]|uniref:Uncharacterized protein n=1 Tax=Scleroderma citrinum Foug A TaxID=1036808 RepID=A0A0C3A213_9AGAM|nr:hypothetical protein SCLCIDRAFT_20733 [Scleroderma citrinum Foug A]